MQRFHDLFDSLLDECSASELTACYIVDDGGFIVSSNDDDLENSVGFLIHLLPHYLYNVKLSNTE